MADEGMANSANRLFEALLHKVLHGPYSRLSELREALGEIRSASKSGEAFIQNAIREIDQHTRSAEADTSRVSINTELETALAVARDLLETHSFTAPAFSCDVAGNSDVWARHAIELVRRASGITKARIAGAILDRRNPAISKSEADEIVNLVQEAGASDDNFLQKLENWRTYAT
jgi:hypothetical protein